MHYVCIENNQISSILNYEPSVPNSITVVTITDTEFNNIKEQTHYFDVADRTVKSVDASILRQKEQEVANAQQREFLRSTDWQVLRHIRQKALNVPTSLTDEAYLALEQQRADAAASIL